MSFAVGICLSTSELCLSPRFDRQLQVAVSLDSSDEAWGAFLKEMKGQMFYLAGLLLLKRAQSVGHTHRHTHSYP